MTSETTSPSFLNGSCFKPIIIANFELPSDKVDVQKKTFAIYIKHVIYAFACFISFACFVNMQ